MYAVIKTGGKQYRVAVGDKLKVETLSDVSEGDKVSLDQVLMICDGDQLKVGSPMLDSSVDAIVLSNGRGKKLRIVKFRRRQNSRTRTGHRQNYTELEITAIGGTGAAKKVNQPKAAKDPVKKSPPIKKTAVKATADKGADDLSKISGVGPVIVGKLKGLGITTFQQVADFTAEEIQRVDEELNFKGRIERDDWVKQAKDFLAD